MRHAGSDGRNDRNTTPQRQRTVTAEGGWPVPSRISRAQLFREGVESLGNVALRLRQGDRQAVVASLASGDIDRDLAQQGHAKARGFALATASTKNVVTLPIAR